MLPARNTYKNNGISVKSEDDCLFKKPLKPAPHRKRVLDEETYLRKIGNIIEKDFFPELANLLDKYEYIESSDNNLIKLRTLYTKYGEKISLEGSCDESPATFDTPFATRDGDQHETPKAKQNDQISVSDESKLSKSMSLDDFMASYTSEDNESFKAVMKDEEKKSCLKHSWLYDAEAKHNSSHIPNLMLPSIEEQKEMKTLSITGTIDKDKDTRPSSIENWNYKVFNSVMFIPEGPGMSKIDTVEKSRFKKKEISHKNTRFTENPFKEDGHMATVQEASAFQATKNDGKVGVDGKEICNVSTAKGYLQDASPNPGVDCSPLMTWGHVDGTPFSLEGSQTPFMMGKSAAGPSYKMPKISHRDELLIKLSEKHNQNHRDRKSKAFLLAKSNLCSPSTQNSLISNINKRSSMSPAAQRFFTSRIKTSNKINKDLRTSYTPSMQSPSSATCFTRSFTPNGSQSHKRTPQLVEKIATPETPSKGLTDGLLQFPNKCNTQQPNSNYKIKRKCAADFF